MIMYSDTSMVKLMGMNSFWVYGHPNTSTLPNNSSKPT